MSENGETSAAIVARLFKDPDGPMGSKWLDSVGTGWTDTSLHRLVEKTSTLSAAKTREIYGHFRTKTQMKGCEGPYWQMDPTTTVRVQAKHLNTLTETPEIRLSVLRTDAVGGLLVVTQVVDETGISDPFITLLAAPSVATFNATTGKHGVLLEDIWDANALSHFLPDLETSVVHCPIMGAQEGFSRAKNLKLSVVELLQDSKPLFFPAGKLLCTQVKMTNASHLRAFYLQEVCDLPVGMRWPIDIGLADFRSSIQGVLLALQARYF